MNIEVTQRIEFECCYILDKRQLQAHRYKLEATVDAPQRQADFGMVINFYDLRDYMKNAVPSDEFIYSQSDDLSSRVAQVLISGGIPTRKVDFNITAEALCNAIAFAIQHQLDLHEPGVRLLEVKLRETSDSFASWSRRKELQA